MGRNVACSISNLSIGDEVPVVFIPLVASKDYFTVKDHPSEYHLVGNVGSLNDTNHYFNPLTFPIFGEYDFYWGLKNIEENVNTSIIKKYFKMDIDDFVSAANASEEDRQYASPHQDIIDNLSGMFILREVYDFICSGEFKLDYSIEEGVGSFFKQIENCSYVNANTEGFDLSGFNIKDINEFLNPFKNFSDLKVGILPHGENIYRSSVEEGNLKKELTDFFTMERVMFKTNRFFFPAFNGEQDGDPEAEKLLLENSIKIVDSKLERWRHG